MDACFWQSDGRRTIWASAGKIAERLVGVKVEKGCFSSCCGDRKKKNKVDNKGRGRMEQRRWIDDASTEGGVVDERKGQDDLRNDGDIDVGEKCGGSE